MLRYKQYLVQFDYPNINILTDEEIADIFATKNRPCLLPWLARNMIPSFDVPSRWSETAQEEFADFFYAGGFCTSSQKLSFVRGGDGLSTEQQLVIFNRIFDFMECASLRGNVQLNQHEISPEELKAIVKMDVNLFPQFGPIKVFTPGEKRNKIAYYKEEIERLTRELENCDNKDNAAALENSIEYDDEKFEKMVAKFKKIAIKLQESASALPKVNETDDGKKGSFDSGIGDLLNECNATVTDVLQYFETADLIRSIDTKDLEKRKCDVDEEDEIFSTLKSLTESSSEVLQELKKLNN